MIFRRFLKKMLHVTKFLKKSAFVTKTSSERKKDRTSSIETAFDACNMDGRVTVNELSEYLGVTAKTVRKRLTEHGGFWIDDGEVGKKNKGKSR